MADGAPTLMGAPAPAPVPQLQNVTVTARTAKGVWGIFKTGTTKPILIADSFVDAEYRAEWRTPDYPLEAGSFATYNKVAMPFQVPVRLAKGGSASDRKTFMDTLDKVAASLDLYDVAMPEKTYIGMNIERIGYTRRAQNGASLIVAEIWLKEIRLADDPTFSNTATQSGQDPVSNGTVQPVAATPAQQQTVTASAPAKTTSTAGKIPDTADAFANSPGGW